MTKVIENVLGQLNYEIHHYLIKSIFYLGQQESYPCSFKDKTSILHDTIPFRSTGKVSFITKTAKVVT